MSKRFRIGFLFLLCATVAGGIAWWIVLPRDSQFRGKPESEWIKSINYNGDDAQTQQWRELGPEGLRLLASTLDKGRYYRKCYRWMMPRMPGLLSGPLSRRLPDPADAHATRMCVISLLSRLGKDAKPVEPAIARAIDDDDEGVRLSAIGCYESGLLDVISAKEKAARLPSFLRALQDPEWAIRNNALVALRFYTNDAPVVVPPLITALQDPNINVRMLAAEALVHLDAPAAIKAGVVPILITILKDPNDQVAYQAGEALGGMGKDAATAVPALVESLKSPSRLTAQTAARALKKIDPEAAAKAGVK